MSPVLPPTADPLVVPDGSVAGVPPSVISHPDRDEHTTMRPRGRGVPRHERVDHRHPDACPRRRAATSRPRPTATGPDGARPGRRCRGRRLDRGDLQGHSLRRVYDLEVTQEARAVHPGPAAGVEPPPRLTTPSRTRGSSRGRRPACSSPASAGRPGDTSHRPRACEAGGQRTLVRSPSSLPREREVSPGSAPPTLTSTSRRDPPTRGRTRRSRATASSRVSRPAR